MDVNSNLDIYPKLITFGRVDLMKHNEWFTERVGTDSVNAAAKKSELPQASLFTHLKRDALPAESVIKISRAYGYNPIQGLVDTEYLEADETGEGLTVVTLASVSDHELLAEMLRRVDVDKSIAGLWERPLDDGFVEEIVEESTKPNLSVHNGILAASTDNYDNEAETWQQEP